MLHIVGIGTLWNRRGILADSGLATVRVTGPLAAAACVNDHGGAAVCTGNAVPAENCLNLDPALTCGAGTIDSHWRESLFRNELMTGTATTPQRLAPSLNDACQCIWLDRDKLNRQLAQNVGDTADPLALRPGMVSGSVVFVDQQDAAAMDRTVGLVHRALSSP